MFKSYESLISNLTLIAVSLQFMSYWYVSQGRMLEYYVLSAIACACCVVINYSLSTRDPSQWSMLLFIGVNIWGLMTLVRGLIRLKREKGLLKIKESSAKRQIGFVL